MKLCKEEEVILKRKRRTRNHPKPETRTSFRRTSPRQIKTEMSGVKVVIHGVETVVMISGEEVVAVVLLEMGIAEEKVEMVKGLTLTTGFEPV
jgi:hypothetical protein